MELTITDEQINHLAYQQFLWSMAATQAIDHENREMWRLSVKSMKSAGAVFSTLSLELRERVESEVRKLLVAELGSEEAREANNQKWRDWQRKLKQERREEK